MPLSPDSIFVSNEIKMEEFSMAGIDNPMAYFTRVVQNMDKNDYRSNDRFYSYISSVGNEQDVLVEMAKIIQEPIQDTIESEIMASCVENWLMHIENEILYSAISELTKSNQFLLYLLYVRELTQKECGYILGIKQASVARRRKRILNQLKSFLAM